MAISSDEDINNIFWQIAKQKSGPSANLQTGNIPTVNSPMAPRAPQAPMSVSGDPTSSPGGVAPGMSLGEGLATFGTNALGIATFGIPSALGLAYGIANNNPSLSLKDAFKGLFDSKSEADKSAEAMEGPGDYGNSDPGVAGVPGGVTGRGADSPSDGNPGVTGGIGGYGTLGPGANDPGVAGVPGGVSGRGGDSSSNGNNGTDNGSSGTGDGGHGEGNGGHHAKGGLIRGPGTGTSDSIKAWLSDGEYVMPADRTKQLLPALEYMRKTGKLPPSSKKH